MMSDLVSRQAAIELVKDVCDAIMSGCDSYYDPETNDEVYKDLLEVDAILKCNKEIRIALRNMPSAEPRKKGKWIPDEIAAYDMPKGEPRGWVPWLCSECGWGVGKHQTAFCPSCGADMRGEHT